MSNLKPGVSQRDIDEQLEVGDEPQAEVCERCGEPLAPVALPYRSRYGLVLCQDCWEGEP